MNGLNRIKERILEDARTEARSRMADAEKRAEEIKKAAEARANEAAARIRAEYEAKAQDLGRRMVSAAQLDMRKKVLAVKQDMIDKAFRACLEALGSMPDVEYRAMLEDMLIKVVETGDEEVVLSQGDAARLGDDFLADVNARLAAMGKKGGLKLAVDPGLTAGGFILRKGGVETNSTFPALLRLIREELEPRVAEILF